MIHSAITRGRAIGIVSGSALLVVLAIGLVVPIWADRDEVILTFEAIDVAGGSGGARLRVESPAGGTQILSDGQHATVAEGEAVTLEILPEDGFALKAWEGAFAGSRTTASYEFYADSVIRAVMLQTGNEEDKREQRDKEQAGQGRAMNRSGRINRGVGQGLAGVADQPIDVGKPKAASVVWVDFKYIGIEVGTEPNPYDTLAEGVNNAELLSSLAEPAIVKIKPGFSAETMTINPDPSAPLRLEAPYGSARIGVASGTVYYLVSVGVSPPSSGSVSGGGAYQTGTNATLSASPAGSYAFSHWTGDLGGFDNPATLNVDANKSVTAIFVQNPANLDVSNPELNGGGSLPTEAVSGDTFDIAWTVTNIGANAASSGDGNWTDNVFLSRDASLDGEDKALNGTGATHSGALNPSNGYATNVEIEIPDVSPGAYYLIMASDVGNETAQTASARAAGTHAHAILLVDPVLNTP